MSKRDAPATARNREPILEVLVRWLEEPARVLEVASGTGQHAVFFAERLPHVVWQPTEPDPTGLASIEAWRVEAGLPNLEPAIALEVSDSDWPLPEARFDAIFNANLIHIAPWRVGTDLLEGSARTLRPGGLLFLYGPFKVAGAHTSASNAAFDESLRQRDPSYGVRDLEEVVEVASQAGLVWQETNDLPANNKLIVFRRA